MKQNLPSRSEVMNTIDSYVPQPLKTFVQALNNSAVLTTTVAASVFLFVINAVSLRILPYSFRTEMIFCVRIVVGVGLFQLVKKAIMTEQQQPLDFSYTRVDNLTNPK